MVVDTFCNGRIDAISVLGNDKEQDSLEGDKRKREEGDDFIPRHDIGSY